MNWGFLLAAITASGACVLYVYTFEVRIWPRMMKQTAYTRAADGSLVERPLWDFFPGLRLGDGYVTMCFFRIVWHLFTCLLIVTIVTSFALALADFFPYSGLIGTYLIAEWVLVWIMIFVVRALCLRPGDSYVAGTIRAFQWVFVLLIIVFLYWGTTTT